jgi:hypothetical protein
MTAAAAYGLGTLARIEQIEAQMADLRLKKQRITANAEKWETETDEAMTARLRRNHTRLGNREARFRLNGEARKPAKGEPTSLAYDSFKLIAKQWRESGAGFRGVALKLKSLADCLGCSERQMRRVVRDLDKLGVIVRIQSTGRPCRYAITNLEGMVYRDALYDTVYARRPRLRHLAKIEAAQPNLERARTVGLERFQDDNYTLPDGCLERFSQQYQKRGITPDI